MTATKAAPPALCQFTAFGGDTPYIQCTYATQKCGTIEGNGTLPHPLRIKLRQEYAAGPELLETMRNILATGTCSKDPARAQEKLEHILELARTAIADATE